MAYKQLPIDMCTGSWPAGSFGTGNDHGLRDTVTTLARLVAAMVTRREAGSWSRAEVARCAGISAHTLGRIEAGRCWPDLATIAHLSAELGLRITFDPPRTRPANELAATIAPGQRPGAVPSSAAATGTQVNDQPLNDDVTGVAEVSSAHVIEAILHNSPRLRAQVEELRQARVAGAAHGSRGRG